MAHQTQTPTHQPDTSGTVDYAYFTIQPNKHTFESTKLRQWVEKHLPDGPVLDACAGNTTLSHSNITRNDLNGGTNIDTTEDVRDLSTFDDNTFNAIIYDPPYSPDRADHLYNSTYPGYGSDVKQEFHRILDTEGVFIQLGWTGMGMPANWGYTRTDTAFFNLLGRQNDWLITIDQLTNPTPHTTSPTTWNPYQSGVTDTINVNQGAGPATADGSTTSLTLSTHYPTTPIPENPLNHDTVQQCITDNLTGRVLVPLLAGDIQTQPEFLLQNDGNIDGTTLATFTDSVSVESRISITELANEYGRAFDTILFAPPRSYFSRSIYDNGTNKGGVNSQAKEQFDQLLTPGGSVIQIGHTATNMPGVKNYTRESVDIIAPITEHDRTSREHDRSTPPITIISTDQKPTNRTSPLMERGAHHPCIYCGDSFPVEPSVAMIACPTCGANTDEYCHESGTILHSNGDPDFHQARSEKLAEKHPANNRCSDSPTGVHRVEPANHIHLPVR